MRRFASLFGRRGVLAAAAIAFGAGAIAVLQQMIVTLSSFAGLGYSGLYEVEYLGTVWSGLGLAVVGYYLPFVLGAFASLWLVAPVAAELRLAHVITRLILAAGIGSSLLFIVRGVLGVFGQLAGVGSLVGYSFPALPWSGIQAELGSALQGAIGAFVNLTPLVILAGVLLWLWLEKHPVRHAVSGMLDEV